jgi:AraC family transcriptional regulator of adaptative response/methylated-DNA-[protein]-cysteine methyltransferase
VQIRVVQFHAEQESGGQNAPKEYNEGMNSSFVEQCENYTRIEQAIRYLETQAPRQPELAETAAQVGLSEYHFQRLFTHWVGISPKRFLQFLTKERAKTLLEHSTSLLGAAYEAGLSGPGRLHDLFVNVEGVTPGEYKTRGAGMEIAYGVHATPFGMSLIGVTERGICHLSFIENSSPASALEDFRSRWGRAALQESPHRTRPLVDQIFGRRELHSLPIHLRGTNFQMKVWEALLRIPSGYVTTYRDVALYLGAPSASRAVGAAVGNNPIAVLIPCHRVIRKDGGLGGYRYGLPRKQALLGWEFFG